MPRSRSPRIASIKAALVTRLRGDFSRPGGRFLSARALAAHYSVSYKTAHTLLGELRDEGLLRRRPASGTYLAGEHPALRGVQLCFHARARRAGSFGAHLMERLESALRERKIEVLRTWADESRTPRLRPEYYPVAWECRPAMQAAAEARCFGLCLNDTPPPGIGGGLIDAISTDDFSGGACAAELLKTRTGRAGGFAVLGGPQDDARSRRRIAGFLAHVADATVVPAESWFVEAGRKHAAAILAQNAAGVFCCNDRLAEAVLTHGRSTGRTLPPIIGFDNAPIARELGLTSVGIPWDAMVEQAVALVVARLDGDTTPAKHITLAHELVLRISG